MAEESAARRAPAKKAAEKATTKKVAAKKGTTKKVAAKKTAKKSTTKTTRKSPAKKTAKKTGNKTGNKTGKQATARKSVARKSPELSATQRVAETVRETAAQAAATGRSVVVKAAAATQKPVEAGRAAMAKAGGRVADAGRAVLTPSTQFLFTAQARAKEMVADPVALRALADQAMRSRSGRSGPLGEVTDEFKTLGRLVAAYSRGDYRDIPLDSLLMVIAGLVYVVSPLDLVPEAIPIAGYADDAVAVGVVIRQVHHELTAFREWEATQPASERS